MHFRSLITGFVLLASSVLALAQSTPGLHNGQVPTAAQWNSYFAAKQDLLGFTPVNRGGDTMSGKLTTFGSSTTRAGFNINPGVAPTTPIDGDMWLTTTGVFAQINGSTVGPIAGGLAGPGVSTDNAFCRWDGTTGKIVQNSLVVADDSGNIGTAGVVVGGSVAGPLAIAAGGTGTPRIEALGTDALNGGLASGVFSATAATAGRLDFYRSRDAAIGNAEVVQSGDRIGAVTFLGAQQTGTFANQQPGAQIRAEVDGTVTSGASADMPGRLLLLTSPDGSATLTERLRIASDGLATFANNVTVSGQIQAGVTTSGTEQATTSGTSIDFTGIPTWAKSITINFVGVSTNGTSDIIVQLGDAGGVETSGYLGSGATLFAASSVQATNYTAGFGVVRSPEAAGAIHGTVTITLEDATDFTWAESGTLSQSGGSGGTVYVSGSSKATSAVTDRVRITTAGGTATFDAGVINIAYRS